jgi:hypothetical protein
MQPRLNRVTFFLFLVGFLSPQITKAQTSDAIQVTVSPDKGVRFQSADGFMEFRLGFRLQQQVMLTQLLTENESVKGAFLIRRARTHFRGSLFYKKLDYFVQISFDRGNVNLLNAEFRWKPDAYTMISFGQFFPPTFRQFQTVSKNLQMVDRSNVTRFFFTNYDLGVSLRRTIPVADNFQIKTAAAITHGEGANTATAPGNWAYMGRIEILPFGAFVAGGDYSESDLAGERSPKLSIGTAYYKNSDAYTKFGNTVWDGFKDDITDISADFVFKYAGFSLLAEYINREVNNEVLVLNDAEPPYIAKITTANGWYAQAGKMLSPQLEPTIRISYLNPNNYRQNLQNKFKNQAKIAVGINYFFMKHSIKWQNQLGLVTEEYEQTGQTQFLELLTQFTLSF